jgi:glutamate decarboxylase
LIRLGKAGYRAIMSNLTQTADFLAESIMKTGGGKKFVLMSKGGVLQCQLLIISSD